MSAPAIAAHEEAAPIGGRLVTRFTAVLGLLVAVLVVVVPSGWSAASAP